MALIAHKTALNPNKTQKKVLNQHCDFARNAYNAALSDVKTGLDNGEFRSVYDILFSLRNATSFRVQSAAERFYFPRAGVRAR